MQVVSNQELAYHQHSVDLTDDFPRHLGNVNSQSIWDFVFLRDGDLIMRSSPWLGKQSVVVGGSSGFGWHLASALYQAGSNVLIVARNEERLQLACQRIRNQADSHLGNPQIDFLAADVASTEGAAALAQRFQQSNNNPPSQVDLLINAVGRSDRGELLGLTTTELEQLIGDNILASFQATKVLLPSLTIGRGIVVNIGSLSSKLAPRFLGGYSTAKFALAGMTQQLRLELADQGVHVMLACPGPIRRDDAGRRYQELSQSREVSQAAAAPGGGAKLKGLDPVVASRSILSAAANRQPELVLPSKVRLLLIVQAISPAWGDWLLRRSTA